MKIHFKDIDPAERKDWHVLDCQTGEPVPDHRDITWADDETGQYEVILRDQEGKLVIHPQCVWAIAWRGGREMLIQLPCPTATREVRKLPHGIRIEHRPGVAS